MTLFINALGVIVDIIMVFLTIKYAPSAGNSIAPPPVIIKQYSKTPTIGIDAFAIVFGTVVAAAVYNQYSQNVFIIVSMVCIIFTVFFYLVAIFKKEKNTVALIISCLTHILVFASLYFLQAPLYVVDTLILSEALTALFSVFGIGFICIVFARQILCYMLKNHSLDTKECLISLLISVIAALLISGYLYHIIDQFQVPL